MYPVGHFSKPLGRRDIGWLVYEWSLLIPAYLNAQLVLPIQPPTLIKYSKSYILRYLPGLLELKGTSEIEYSLGASFFFNRCSGPNVSDERSHLVAMYCTLLHVCKHSYWPGLDISSASVERDAHIVRIHRITFYRGTVMSSLKVIQSQT